MDLSNKFDIYDVVMSFKGFIATITIHRIFSRCFGTVPPGYSYVIRCCPPDNSGVSLVVVNALGQGDTQSPSLQALFGRTPKFQSSEAWSFFLKLNTNSPDTMSIST